MTPHAGLYSVVGSIVRRVWPVGARPDAARLGRRSERLAVRRLRRRGYRILARNLTIGGDEADAVALDPDGETVVIVEVKARRGGGPPAALAVDHRKRRRLVRLAHRLRGPGRLAGRPIRFDVITVQWTPDGRPHVQHLVGAFDASD